MEDDTSLFDCTTDIWGSGPTWLEVIASHAQALPAIDKREDVAEALRRQISAQPDCSG